tara:strand:+ start:400 stop:738 length:339 start_codon:yes stop_codon:yes gene_type:complete
LSRDFIYKRRIRETNAGETNTILRLLPLLSVVAVFSFFSFFSFFFSFFLSSFFAFNERIFFSNFAQKNPKRFDHRKTPPRNRKRSGERDLTKTFDLSLSLLKRTDALFYFAL